MSSYDKVVKLACKPKAAPPKAKYIDPIIAATWSDDGAVSDVCKALSPRFREPNAIIVFKALIVLHTMIRNGATDNVLSYLSSTEILRLRNVSSGNWEGYAAPENLQNYATYLDSRIRAYRDLKHDAIRVQAETNRDMRNSASTEEEGYKSRKERLKPTQVATTPSRSKTIVGRKLRVMTVEKGLLRETKAVHNMIDALVECRFYLDDLEDELTITALRMLVKDLLILFQAGNEGVINVLEHYFEMSHIDAQEALNIYRHFCKQTEMVVEYLGVAKKLQNLLNVPIPNLKHAPVSLAGALQEYLDDASFEDNRREYKANKEAIDHPSKRPSSASGSKGMKSSTVKFEQASTSSTSQASTSPATNGAAEISPSEKKELVDFFSAIEGEQPTMFNPQTNSPNAAYFQQQGAANPFSQVVSIQQPQMVVQPTGYITPQQAPNPFNNFLSVQQPQQPPPGHRPFSSFLPPQQTGFLQQVQQTGLLQQVQQTGLLQQPQQTGFLQPQATGPNPFRQSMMIPQTTGTALFGNMSHPGPNLYQNQGNSSISNPATPQTANPGFAQFSMSASAIAPQPSIFGPTSTGASISVPNRPSSTPLTSSALSQPMAQPVKTHQTGSKNPFGPISTPAPTVPKVPTLMELSMGFQIGNTSSGTQQQYPPQQNNAPLQSGASSGFNFGASALNPGSTNISSVASSFTNIGKQSNEQSATSNFTPSPVGVQNTSTTTTGSMFSDPVFSSPSSSQPTRATTASSASSGPLRPQYTGFAALKPFKPTSSFGTTLMESLPSIPSSSATTSTTTGNPNTGAHNGGTLPTTSTPNSTSFSFGQIQSQPTNATGPFGNSIFGSNLGSTLGQGLRPQMTGGGAANPFRASMMAGGPNFGFTPPFQSTPNVPSATGQAFGGTQALTPTGAFSSQFNANKGQQQNASASLL